MSFDWKDYLSLAKRLLACPPQDSLYEAKLRSAISRAYYSVLMTATTYLEETESFEVDRTRPTHVQVWALFHDPGDVARQKIGQDGDRLRRDRVRADYRSIFHNLPGRAKLVVVTAEEIINNLAELESP